MISGTAMHLEIYRHHVSETWMENANRSRESGAERPRGIVARAHRRGRGGRPGPGAHPQRTRVDAVEGGDAAEDRGQRAEGGAVGDHVVLVEDVGALAQGSVALSLRTTTQPLHTRFTRIIGASLSGVTMRPDPTVSPASKSRPPRWQSPPWQLSTASQPMDSRPGHEP